MLKFLYYKNGEIELAEVLTKEEYDFANLGRDNVPEYTIFNASIKCVAYWKNELELLESLKRDE